MTSAYLILAASTQRTVGLVLAAIAISGFILYWVFNWFQGRAETGSEVELAVNRKPYHSDDVLETKKLDSSLFAGLLCLVVIGVALPLYWMGEPGRHEGLVEENDEVAVHRGEHLYEERCASCHGTVSGPGGSVPYTLTDDNSLFLGNLDWKAPSLATVLYRYSVEEVEYILNYGRPNTPMPAWGAPGGGPFTTQEIDEVIAYLAHEQVETVEEMRQRVDDGLAATVRQQLVADDPGAGSASGQLIIISQLLIAGNPGLADDPGALDEAVAEVYRAGRHRNLKPFQEPFQDDPDALDAAVAAALESIKADQVAYGELLFNNEGDNGVYGCARCHTPGWSYDADEVRSREGNTLISPEVPGGGGFGPNLGETTRQFDTASDHEAFVTLGSQNGVAYGNFGQGDGGGQMPAFGVCVADRDAGERDFIARDGFCDRRGGEGVLTEEQVAAIVAYEREVLARDN